MNAALLAVALSAVAAPAPADEIKLPEGVPPVQVVARLDKDGRVEITDLVMQYREEKRTRTRLVNGVAVAQEYSVTTVIPVARKRTLPEKGGKVYTTAGKEVAAKDLAEKLKKPAIAFLAWDGKKPDPFYLKPLKDDVLVIVPPPGAPAPADAGGKPGPDKPPPPARHEEKPK